jgi:hypothetical protein
MTTRLAVEPLRMASLGQQVCRVSHQDLEVFQGVPAVHVGVQPHRRVHPGFLPAVPRDRLGRGRDGLIQRVELIVEVLPGEDEGRCVPGCSVPGLRPRLSTEIGGGILGQTPPMDLKACAESVPVHACANPTPLDVDDPGAAVARAGSELSTTRQPPGRRPVGQPAARAFPSSSTFTSPLA